MKEVSRDTLSSTLTELFSRRNPLLLQQLSTISTHGIRRKIVQKLRGLRRLKRVGVRQFKRLGCQLIDAIFLKNSIFNILISLCGKSNYIYSAR